MGPPISTWPYSAGSEVRDRRSALVDNFRVICLNFTFAVVFFQVMFGLSSVGAGPVVLNMDYMQGPVPLARNIRHLPCISRRTGQEGLCMFAIDCLKANGTHLGTCIDRFYFGSCCQIPDKTILPQIITTNHIDDNSIDNANFVHPQTEDKLHNKIPDIFPTRKPTTQKIETTTKEIEKTTTVTEKTESIALETKSDEPTTIDNRIISDELKTTVSVEATTKADTLKPVTDIPIKLSTFQSVSSDVTTSSTEKYETTVVSTEKPRKPTRRPIKPYTRPTYKPVNSTRPQYTLSSVKPKPPISLYNTTRKPPYKTPPRRQTTKRPFPIPPRLNITILPQSTSSKPLLTRPSSVLITYINATQSTTTEPKTTTTTTTTPSTTAQTEVIESTIVTEAPTEKVTTEFIETVATVATEAVKETTIELIKETTNQSVEKEPTSEINKLTTISLTNEDKETNQDNKETSEDDKETNQDNKKTSEGDKEMSQDDKVTSEDDKPMSQDDKETTSDDKISQEVDSESQNIEKVTNEVTTTIKDEEKQTTVQIATENIIRPATEAEPSTIEVTSTEYPPLVTWTNTVDTVTKTPEKPTEASDEIWSPITPPEGWILLSTIKPVTSTTTTTTTTTEAPTIEPLTTQQETTAQITETTEKSEPIEVTVEPIITTLSTTTTEAPATEAQTTTTSTTTTTEATTTTTTTTEATTKTSEATTTSEASTTKPTTEGTTQPILEFTVNVTLSPTVPSTTSSFGLTTFTSVTTADNSTKTNDTETSSATTVTEIPTTTEISLESLGTDKNDYKKVCGRRLWQEPTARIVGGKKSGFGMWPWQISLRQYRTSTYLHKCGAALLNENWAITAAHCVEHVPPSELLVRLGEHDLADEKEPFGFAERRVQIVASHPHFDPATFEYDLALLRFYEPVKFQPNILPICVPDTDEDFVGRTAFVTGWGRLYDEGPLPSVLQEVEVPVINNTACEAMYQAAGYNEHIPNIFICAGRSKGGTDSCEGDSGGPMVIPRQRDGRYVLGGIISWGIGCAEPNQPGVYTRISEFRDWINQILQF